MADPVSSDLEWDDEVADEEVVNLVTLLWEAHRFVGHEFAVVEASTVATRSEMEGESSSGGDRERPSQTKRKHYNFGGTVMENRRVTRSSSLLTKKTGTCHPPVENIRVAVDDLKKWVLLQFRSFKEDVLAGLSSGEKSRNDGHDNENLESSERRQNTEKENEDREGYVDERTRVCGHQVDVITKGERSARRGKTELGLTRSTKLTPEGVTYSAPMQFLLFIMVYMVAV